MNEWKKNLSDEIYHADAAISSTQLREVLRSPAHYVASKNQPKRDTPALRFGRLFHSAALEREAFLKRMRIAPDFGDLRSKTNREKKEEWTKSLPENAVVLDQSEADQITEMANSILNHSEASKLLSKGIAEISGFFTDPESGVRCRIRPDFLHESPIVVDLKTTQDASPREFERSAWKFLYPVQAAFYCHGASIISGKQIGHFYFIAIEKEAPYAVSVFHASTQFMDKGFSLMRQALATVAECQRWETRLSAAGKDPKLAWPAYDRSVQELGIPTYAVYQE